ncbi:ankyrin repeat domain-containing protein [Zalerion maritima]|uniref:Ankyrin repeat domain-containing protein n=1 Tax=Zalerion maritima TaxID=339359 RepID=A0AAD5S0H4_9PEZI|nr:ankyrin repeat domain-containing protein [Zalerion maritima]
MDNVLKDVQILAAHRAFAPALEAHAHALDDARFRLEYVARECPSLPDAAFDDPSANTNINYGKNQIINTVKGI